MRTALLLLALLAPALASCGRNDTNVRGSGFCAPEPAVSPPASAAATGCELAAAGSK